MGLRQMLPWQMNNTFIIYLKLLENADFPWFCATFRHFYNRGLATITWYNYACFCLFLPSFVVNSVVNSKDLRHAPFTVRCRFLRSGTNHFLHFFLCIIVIQMGVNIQRYTDVTMAHDILKCLRIHSRLRHIGTESVSANMWTCQVWDKKNISFFLPDSTYYNKFWIEIRGKPVMTLSILLLKLLEWKSKWSDVGYLELRVRGSAS